MSAAQRFSSAILGAILAGSLGPFGVARADVPSAAICTWTGQATFSPGLTLTPQRGTLQFQGQSGSIDCRGTSFDFWMDDLEPLRVKTKDGKVIFIEAPPRNTDQLAAWDESWRVYEDRPYKWYWPQSE